MTSLADAAPVAFVATTDGTRARAFYEGMLGLRFVADDGAALVFAFGTATLRVTPVDKLVPQAFTVLGWRVADVAAEVRALGARGVAFERYPALEQDENGIWTSPGGGHVAWFRDPDGNVLSLSDGETG